MSHSPTAAALAPVADPRKGVPADLTPEQRAAVEHGIGPLMIFAGPGAGKTRTITHRIARLLEEGVAKPHEIVAVTFTVAAAGEMRERLAAMLGVPAIQGATVSTFHSLCARLLRAHASHFGRTSDFTIYDPGDVSKVIAAALADETLAEVQQRLAECQGPDSITKPAAGLMVKEISLAKNRLWTPAHYAAHSQHPLAPLIAAVWAQIERDLVVSNAFDFDDLLTFTVRLLAEQPRLRADYQARWTWILVDEFQDTNYAQMAIVSLLGGIGGNVTVVADDDQLLYSFRGAESDNVLNFGAWFPDFRQIALGRNYRCRAEILDVAVRCVSHNRHRVPKQLIAMRGGGGHVHHLVFGNEHQEAEQITKLVSGKLGAGVKPEDILLVARNARLTLVVGQSLAAHGIPYRVLGSLGLFERSEVKDAVAYLTLLANPADAQAFRRAIGAPKRGVGPATAHRIIQHARSVGRSDLIHACQDAEAIEGIRSNATRQAVASFGRHLASARTAMSAGRSLSHVVTSALMMPGGLVAHFQNLAANSDRDDVRVDAERVLEDLRSLYKAAGAYSDSCAGAATMAGFLEVACGLENSRELNGEDERLTISTIHRCKGMEAHMVVLIGCEEQVMPHWRALEPELGSTIASSGGLEEERRLFYVAATRAKDCLVITRARRRDDRPTAGPSRFLLEAGLD